MKDKSNLGRKVFHFKEIAAFGSGSPSGERICCVQGTKVGFGFAAVI